MYTATLDTMQLLDTLFEGRHLVPKDVLVEEAENAHLGEDAIVVIRELPEGTYTHEGLIQQLQPEIERRVRSREEGMRESPGWGRHSGDRRHHGPDTGRSLSGR